MNLQTRTSAIVNLVTFCKYCHPLSGCILSDLKGKKKKEIKSFLGDLSEEGYQRILSYHDSCPYRDRLAM